MQTHTQEECYVKVKAEVEMLLQARIASKSPETKKEAWNRLFLPAPRKNRPCPNLELGTSHFQSLWSNSFLLCKPHHLWDFLLYQPEQTNTSSSTNLLVWWLYFAFLNLSAGQEMWTFLPKNYVHLEMDADDKERPLRQIKPSTPSMFRHLDMPAICISFQIV